MNKDVYKLKVQAGDRILISVVPAEGILDAFARARSMAAEEEGRQLVSVVRLQKGRWPKTQEEDRPERANRAPDLAYQTGCIAHNRCCRWHRIRSKTISKAHSIGPG
jgi:hypothetical protein